jgi:NAD(P)-dependent dehydrogenase (short-subunit alcohol dehydrogenase family)
MPPRVTIITGASSGIGLATSVALAQSGDTVVATMRDPGKAKPLLRAADDAGVAVEVLPLDVTDDGSVTDCIDTVLERHGTIDILVNNAGVGCSGTLEELSADDFSRSLDVNFLGVVRTTKAVLPHMRAAGKGHLIAVSSIAGVFGQPFNDAYCASKFALEGLYEALSPVAAAFGVHVSVVEAGPVTGNFQQRSLGVQDRPASSPFLPLWQQFSAIAERGYEGAQTPQEIADAIVAVACDPAPALRYQSSPSVKRLLGLKLADVSGERITGMTRSWLTARPGNRR